MTREEAERLVKRLVRACCESDYYHTIDDETEKLIAALAPAPHADDVAAEELLLQYDRALIAAARKLDPQALCKPTFADLRTALLARLRQRDDVIEECAEVAAPFPSDGFPKMKSDMLIRNEREVITRAIRALKGK